MAQRARDNPWAVQKVSDYHAAAMTRCGGFNVDPPTGQLRIGSMRLFTKFTTFPIRKPVKITEDDFLEGEEDERFHKHITEREFDEQDLEVVEEIDI